jgi:hypothetical protein
MAIRPESELEVVAGAPVFNPHGERLGTVKEVQGDTFKVDAPLQPDYWLSFDCIRSASATAGVMLAFNADQLAGYKTVRPGSVV